MVSGAPTGPGLTVLVEGRESRTSGVSAKRKMHRKEENQNINRRLAREPNLFGLVGVTNIVGFLHWFSSYLQARASA